MDISAQIMREERVTHLLAARPSRQEYEVASTPGPACRRELGYRRKAR